MKTASKMIVRERALDALFIVAGSILFALGIDLFIVHAQISMGGVTGVSLILNFLTRFPLGAGIIILNIPIFLVARKSLGAEFAIKSLIAMVFSSIVVDILAFLPSFTSDPLLASLYGGLLLGAGLGLIFSRGATTGGVDIISKLILMRFPHLSIGRVMLVIDVCVVVVSALVFQSVQTLLYSFIAIFVNALVIDKILGGVNQAKMALVISVKPDALATEITKTMQRGVTSLDGKGFYTKKDRPVLLCVIRKQELFELKGIVRRIDPGAFVILCEATEVLGLGFKTKE